jgi:hypothetical protein
VCQELVAGVPQHAPVDGLVDPAFEIGVVFCYRRVTPHALWTDVSEFQRLHGTTCWPSARWYSATTTGSETRV